MNDIEDLVREEMRARVAAAEAEAAGDEQAGQPTALLGRLNRRIRQARLRRGWAASVLSAAAIAAAVALPLALLSPGSVSRVGPTTHGSGAPLTDTAVTPSGWSPVAYGDAQISVPSSWYLQFSGAIACSGGVHRMLVFGPARGKYISPPLTCGMTASGAAIGTIPAPIARGHLTGKVNGIGVIRVSDARGYLIFLVPALHVRVIARGPLASRVLATLTQSPLSVVLARGRPFPVPSRWRWHDFRGIRFAAPASWGLVRNGHWGCPPFIARATVNLIPAANSQRPRCPLELPTAGLVTGRNGVIAGAGSYGGPDSSGYDGCRVLHGLRACYVAEDVDELLIVSVFGPGRDRATLVEIGLAGNGAVARTIFDSIGPR
jgi:hypothetical protein